jgi:hypothetical protein
LKLINTFYFYRLRILGKLSAGTNPNLEELDNGNFIIYELLPGDQESVILNFEIDEAFQGNLLSNFAQIIVDDGDDIDSDPDTDETIDEDGDGNGDDDDEDRVDIDIVNGIEIGDYVWLDANGNGIQDFNERGVEGIEVVLFNKRGFKIRSMLTDNNGFYLFSGITPGEYYVEFVLPETYQITRNDRGNDDTRDSDVDDFNGPNTTRLYNIQSNNYSIDAGILKCVEITGTVWFDYNENDIHDLTENGINGLKVELYKLEFGDWVLWEVQYTGHKPGTPSDDGYYTFCVDPGSYYLRFVNPPETLVPVRPFAGAESVSSKVNGRFGYGTTDSFDAVSGFDISDMNAGYYPMASVGDYVWMDINSNGMREPDEPGVANVTVKAINSSGEVVAEAISDEEGRYMVDYLQKDDYYLEVSLPFGMQLTEPKVGDDETMDSDVDGSNGEGTTQMMSLSPGMHKPNIDIGILESVLPVEWVDFKGWNQGNKNRLEWHVTNELNVDRYILMRSENDYFDFYPLGELLYKEPESDINVYTADDFDIESGKVYYYKVRQVDYDGQESISKIISVQSADFIFEEVTIGMYPNPAYDRVMLTFDHMTTITSGELMFISGSGEIVRKEKIENVSISPDRPLSFDISDLPNGIYSWLLVFDDFSVVDKIVIID